MILKERSYRLLVVSSSDAFNKTISLFLKDYNFINTCYALSANTAKKDFLENAYDLVLISAPLSDEFGTHLAIDITQGSGCVTLVLTKSENFADVFDKVFRSGVYVMLKPISRALLEIAFEWMITTRERLSRAEKKQLSLEEKMAEIRTVNKAKWILIEQLKMSESDAHRYIEKMAMDMCKPRKDIAETIIKTYI